MICAENRTIPTAFDAFSWRKVSISFLETSSLSNCSLEYLRSGSAAILEIFEHVVLRTCQARVSWCFHSKLKIFNFQNFHLFISRCIWRQLIYLKFPCIAACNRAKRRLGSLGISTHKQWTGHLKMILTLLLLQKSPSRFVELATNFR